MQIKPSTVNKGWFTVHVDKDELITDSGKPLPYPMTIGVINARGTIKVWSPAASKPRGYIPAARRMMEEAKRQVDSGAVPTLPPGTTRG